MPFKVVDAKGRQGSRVSKTMELGYYGKNAQFRVSPAAFEFLGEPEKVEILYDEDAGKIGLRASTEPHAVSLRADSPQSRSRYFGFRALADMIGLGENRATIELTPSEEESDTLEGVITNAA